MFKTLKTTTTLAGLATLTLISTLSLEAHAQSSAQFNEAFLSAPQQFDTRRTVRRSSSSNTNDHLVGGLIGAVAGGVIGSQFDNYRRINGGQRYTQTYRSDFGYAKYGNSDFEGYNRRGFWFRITRYALSPHRKALPFGEPLLILFTDRFKIPNQVNHRQHDYEQQHEYNGSAGS